MNKSAHDTYLERHAEVMAKLEKVKIMLETHAMREATDQSNWGFAGDLGYFSNQLGQILGEEG
jgi:hypothetical protein